MEADLDVDLGAAISSAVELAPEDAFIMFIETAVDHRDLAMTKGFSPEAAEAMAVSLHSGLVALYFASVGQ